MAGGFPVEMKVCAGASFGVNLATTKGATVQSAGTPTKGSWVQLGSATTYPISLLRISINSSSGSNQFMVDIGIGAGGSQVVLISNYYFCVEQINGCQDAIIPIDIPAGTTLWARAADNGGFDTCFVSVAGFSSGFSSGNGGAESFGVNTATVVGTLITTGGTANTFTGYTQLIAATGRAYSGLCLGLTPNSNAAFIVSLAIGGAGSEQIIIPNAFANFTYGTPAIYYPIEIPAGVRVSARAQCDTASGSIYVTGLGLFK